MIVLVLQLSWPHSRMIPRSQLSRCLRKLKVAIHGSVGNACIQARYKWGYPDQYLLDLWFGDTCDLALSFQTLTRLMKGNNSDTGLYLSPPHDFEQPNRTEIYLERIRSLLKPGEDGKKHLIIGPCEKLRSQLHNLPADARKIEIEDFPAVSGSGICSSFSYGDKALVTVFGAGI